MEVRTKTRVANRANHRPFETLPIGGQGDPRTDGVVHEGGALAVGATATGAVAIGALAIRALIIEGKDTTPRDRGAGGRASARQRAGRRARAKAGSRTGATSFSLRKRIGFGITRVPTSRQRACSPESVEG
jgi:hypothetical protein